MAHLEFSKCSGRSGVNLFKKRRVAPQSHGGKPMLHAAPFYYIYIMKALVVTPKNDDEFKFVTRLLKKMGISSSAVTQADLEDIGMSKLMRGIDKTKKVSRAAIMKKLSS